MMSECLFIDLQGFKTCKNEFIVKEFAYSTNNYTQVFLIKPPFRFSSLLEAEKRQVKWLETNKGILWSEGFIDFREFKRMIRFYLVDKTIYVKGLEKVKWVKDLCDRCTVINLEEKGAPSFNCLYENYGGNESTFNCVHHQKVCALKNVVCLKKWYEYNNN